MVERRILLLPLSLLRLPELTPEVPGHAYVAQARADGVIPLLWTWPVAHDRHARRTTPEEVQRTFDDLAREIRAYGRDTRETDEMWRRIEARFERARWR